MFGRIGSDSDVAKHSEETKKGGKSKSNGEVSTSHSLTHGLYGGGEFNSRNDNPQDDGASTSKGPLNDIAQVISDSYPVGDVEWRISEPDPSAYEYLLVADREFSSERLNDLIADVANLAADPGSSRGSARHWQEIQIRRIAESWYIWK